ncbi:MAG: phosphopantetheine-binding protein, partial [Gammaproteobacteria bacterium]
MAAVQAPRDRVAALIARFEGVKIANHNAPEQSVISGPKAAIEAAVQALAGEQLRAVMLPVSGAFHTALVEGARAPLSAAIRATRFAPPQCTVYANSSGAAYPDEPAAMQALLDGHLLNSVEFVAQIEAMHAAGCRVFVELGPKSICSNMVRQILAGRDALAVSFDAGNGLRGTLMALAELYAAGAAFDVMRLFETRSLDLLELPQLSALAQPPALPRHAWMVSGGCARPLDDPQHRTGKLAPLTKASAEAAHARFDAGWASARQAPSAVGLKPDLQQQGVQGTQGLASPALAGEALVAYQQTMRQFLQLQERVVQQFLGGGVPAALPVAASALPEPIDRLVSVAPAPVIPEPPKAESGIQPAGTSASNPDRASGATAMPAPAADFKSVLLGLVAERTGYPEDMLGLDADLEADLGIDSIKRVEILGAFQKALPADIGSRVQAGMERFTRAKTLNAILDEVGRLAAAVIAGQPQAESGIQAQSTNPGNADRASGASGTTDVDFKTLLLGLVAERTGYPEDMLGLDADLEADLGIDSSKRVEILGAFQKALPAEIGGKVQAAMERFTRAKTLNAILNEINSLSPRETEEGRDERGAGAAGDAPVPNRLPSPPAPLPEAEGSTEALPRYVLKPVPKPLSGNPASLEGLTLILGGPQTIALPLQARLGEQGATVLHLADTGAEPLRAAIAAARERHGPVRALLHLHGLTPTTAASLDEWRDKYRRNLLTLFHATQALGTDLAQARVLAATRLGGTFGRDTMGPGSITAGGVVGMLNCLRHEFPQAVMRALDFDGQTEDEIAGRLA